MYSCTRISQFCQRRRRSASDMPPGVFGVAEKPGLSTIEVWAITIGPGRAMAKPKRSSRSRSALLPPLATNRCFTPSAKAVSSVERFSLKPWSFWALEEAASVSKIQSAVSSASGVRSLASLRFTSASNRKAARAASCGVVSTAAAASPPKTASTSLFAARPAPSMSLVETT